MFTFTETTNYFPKWLIHFTCSPVVPESTGYSTLLPTVYIFRPFNFSHSSAYVVVSSFGLNLHFSDDSEYGASFKVPIAYSYILFCGMSLTELLSCYWVLRVLFIFSLSLWYIFRYTYIHAYAHTHQIFSPMSYLFIFLQCLSKGGLKFWWCLIYYLFFFWDLCFLCP